MGFEEGLGNFVQGLNQSTQKIPELLLGLRAQKVREEAMNQQRAISLLDASAKFAKHPSMRNQAWGMMKQAATMLGADLSGIPDEAPGGNTFNEMMGEFQKLRADKNLTPADQYQGMMAIWGKYSGLLESGENEVAKEYLKTQADQASKLPPTRTYETEENGRPVKVTEEMDRGTGQVKQIGKRTITESLTPYKSFYEGAIKKGETDPQKIALAYMREKQKAEGMTFQHKVRTFADDKGNVWKEEYILGIGKDGKQQVIPFKKPYKAPKTVSLFELLTQGGPGLAGGPGGSTPSFDEGQGSLSDE